MARIRTIKPDFFRHEALQDLEIEHPGKYPMFVYPGLWTICDKNGVFLYRPRQIKLDILPFLPFDMAETLDILVNAGFIKRFVVDGKEYGFIPSFSKHQRITGTEAYDSGQKYPIPSEIIEKQDRNTLETLAQNDGNNFEGREEEREEEKEKEEEMERRKKNSSEAKKTASELVVSPSAISIPLLCKKSEKQLEFGINQAMIDDWSDSYPAVDVLQELRNIRQWNIANPTRRKTKNGILRHINAWLTEKQNKGSPKKYNGFETLVSTGNKKLDISITNAANFVKRRLEVEQTIET